MKFKLEIEANVTTLHEFVVEFMNKMEGVNAEIKSIRDVTGENVSYSSKGSRKYEDKYVPRVSSCSSRDSMKLKEVSKEVPNGVSKEVPKESVDSSKDESKDKIEGVKVGK